MRGIRHIMIVMGLLLFSNFSFSQLTKVYADKYKEYRDGLELYDKGAFSAAQEKFKQVIKFV